MGTLISFNYYPDSYSVISIPQYCAAAREYDTKACNYLRFVNYNAHPNYYNHGTGSRICRVCMHCVGRYSLYPKIVHGFMWSVIQMKLYPGHIKDQIENIDDYVSYTRYTRYLAGLAEDTHYNCSIDITYSFHIVRRYISRWHTGRV